MKLTQRFRRFGTARDGLAALEFAIIAPMMIFLLFASVELIDVLDTNQRAQNATASVADVTARDTEVSDEEIAGLWAALDILLFPGGGADMQIRVTSVTIIDATTARVVWSEGHGMSPRAANSDVSLPAGMMTPGTSVIMAESVYPYNAPLGFLFEGSMNLKHTLYRRSRLVDPIPRVA
jgi:Flp pilus assembly protein TadG